MGFLHTMVERARQEGVHEGRVDAILISIRALKFGPLPEGTRTRLLAMDDAALDRVLERLLMAKSLEDIIADG